MIFVIGRNLFAQTLPKRDAVLYGTKIDSHGNYIDIQYTIDGRCQKLAVRSYGHP